jgi:hypothetical protein
LGNDRALKGVKKVKILMNDKDIKKAEDVAKEWIRDYEAGKINVKLYE